MIFIVKWLISYLGVMFAMSLDNVFWIPDSPEWKELKKHFYIINFMNREYGFPKDAKGYAYTWNNRILEVLKHPRDILPATVTSLLLAVVL